MLDWNEELQVFEGYEEDYAYHAPSESVAYWREQRAERRRRDREELHELWVEEQRARRRERFAHANVKPQRAYRLRNKWQRAADKRREEA